ncbi:hypothetical protein [Caenimonas soli]|uniref:hypothetical protein n=1 Tax=Caenimonas soli TaxID=2735555 RepID=UPI00155540B8|nr:hypothetical protein [Caenimonas soli]NPC56900.1 hypothetical protein [Caenimonas soli]
MDHVMFNNVLRFDSEDLSGFYRVIVATKRADCVLLYRIRSLKEDPKNTFQTAKPEDGSIKKFAAEERRRYRWVKWSELEASEFKVVAIGKAPGTPAADMPLPGNHARYFETRKKVMSSFLELLVVEKAWLGANGFAKLVRANVKEHGVRRGSIYDWWHLLCAKGFVQESLRPQVHRCGGPGEKRPWGANNFRKLRKATPCVPRLKPGRYTNKERDECDLKKVRNQPPGWNPQDERSLIAAYRQAHAKEKKSFTKLLPVLIPEVFATEFVEINGVLTPVMPSEGSFPNVRSARRIITKELGAIQLLRDQTTAGHFTLNHRGLVGRSYKGVPGPGHRYGIDATRGDIHLRSSINRSWIVGRPIVYLVVDTWSTAIVGFYCCLEGPSWATAQVGLYSTVCGADLVSEIWGVPYLPSLVPSPTICRDLVVDRGELFSSRAALAADRIGWFHKVMPSYRADLKGWLEVLHRILKDQMYAFVPGAINARRKEYELRGDKSKESTLTLRAYAAVIALEIERYNCCADRRYRVTQEMIEIGVVPTPAGLWKFGHDVGLGYRKYVDGQLLIEELLPKIDLRVTRQGLFFGRLEYTGPREIVTDWTVRARNFDSFRLGAHFHPGSISRLWVPDQQNGGVIDLRLSMQAVAKPETTFDEAADFQVASTWDNARHEHSRTTNEIGINARRSAILEREKELTLAADANANKEIPSTQEARAMELEASRGAGSGTAPTQGSRALHAESGYEAQGSSRYEQMLQSAMDQALPDGAAGS